MPSSPATSTLFLFSSQSAVHKCPTFKWAALTEELLCSVVYSQGCKSRHFILVVGAFVNWPWILPWLITPLLPYVYQSTPHSLSTYQALCYFLAIYTTKYMLLSHIGSLFWVLNKVLVTAFSLNWGPPVGHLKEKQQGLGSYLVIRGL